MLNSLILKTVEPLTKIYLMIGRQIQNKRITTNDNPN